MRATKRTTHKRNGVNKKISALKMRTKQGINSGLTSLSGTMKPIKRKITTYVSKKPYRTATIATLVSGVLLGLAYMKMRQRHTILGRFYRF